MNGFLPRHIEKSLQERLAAMPSVVVTGARQTGKNTLCRGLFPERRLMKMPKIYWCDTGLALYLTGGEPSGAFLENLVLNDLLAWKDSQISQHETYHWRTASGQEVDFVIESDFDLLLPIKVMATKSPGPRDALNLRAFHGGYGDQATSGLLIHDGTRVEWLDIMD